MNLETWTGIYIRGFFRDGILKQKILQLFTLIRQNLLLLDHAFISVTSHLDVEKLLRADFFEGLESLVLVFKSC